MYPPPYNPSTTPQSLSSQVSQVMKRVYVKMTFALIVTALVALFCSNPTGPYISYVASHSWVMWVLVIAEFGILFGVQGAVRRMNPGVASLLFYLFAVINGLLMAPVFIVYTTASIVKTFFITAGTFGAMSIYGYFTDRDLSRIGSFLYMALWGLIIAIVVNLFFHSSTLEWIISIAGVLIFVGLTAWDTQQVKNLAQGMPGATDGRLATLGALILYLDFVNLFLYLLRFFGDQRN